jgi:signal recognition particle GTPase
MDIPESFQWPTLNSFNLNVAGAFKNAFNSPEYTLTRPVTDFVKGNLNEKREVFSLNQPQSCKLSRNRKVQDIECSEEVMIEESNAENTEEETTSSSEEKINETENTENETITSEEKTPKTLQEKIKEKAEFTLVTADKQGAIAHEISSEVAKLEEVTSSETSQQAGKNVINVMMMVGSSVGGMITPNEKNNEYSSITDDPSNIVFKIQVKNRS